MKTHLHPDYKTEYPERFNWGMIDSVNLTPVAEQLAKQCRDDMTAMSDDGLVHRLYVPGLRIALCVIAQNSEI